MPESILAPLGTQAPNTTIFQPQQGHWLPPAHAGAAGPRSTNKFWANWLVARGAEMPVYPMPYVLKWLGGAELHVSQAAEPEYYYGDASNIGSDRIKYYFTPFVGEFALGAAESMQGGDREVVQEGVLGVHVELRGPPPAQHLIRFPIFSGMAYVSGRYYGCTPKITSQRAIVEVLRVRSGVWRFRNNGGAEFRVYLLDAQGEFAAAGYDFNADGQLNRAFSGWVRVARVAGAPDRDLLDAHARAVVVGWDLEAETGGRVRYLFQKEGPPEVEVLHWAYAHHAELMAPGTAAPGGLAPLRGPTKGYMHSCVGDAWALRVDLAESSALGFLPAGAPSAGQAAAVEGELEAELGRLSAGSWRPEMLKVSYYFSGKGFQKVGMVCLLAEEFFGRTDGRTQSCADLLARGFLCLYASTPSQECAGAPAGFYYDQDWGGVVTRQGYDTIGCEGWDDFGNACYNDHHYHFGYFVVAAAILVKLRPGYLDDAVLRGFVEALIRDTTNPSAEDPYFPRFRHFDWFDLHSWSRGVVPNPDGKDQESTSEELNLHYGVHLWGTVTGNHRLQQLGATMLALAAVTVKEFFLMETGNPHHHPDFVRNHATGIFFQNKVDYTTWFGSDEKYMHGIQMLPLSPALLLTRRPSYCQEVWENLLGSMALDPTDTWTSILLTGARAIIQPDCAFNQLSEQVNFDDGLSRAWALYWAASLPDPGLYEDTDDACPPPTTPAPTPSPSPSPPPTGDAACAAHAACSHLVGNCCPTDSGVLLGCCGTVSQPSTATTTTTTTAAPATAATATATTVTPTTTTTTTTTTSGCDGETSTSYADGPRVGNAAYYPDCSTSFFTLEEARRRCTEDPGCSVLHDFNCDGRGWRVCSGDAGSLLSSGPGREACTQVARVSCVTTSTATATSPDDCSNPTKIFADGPRVGNAAYYPDCSNAHFDLEVARDLCAEDSSCSALHDYNCDGVGWRYCSVGIDRIQAAHPGTKACTEVATLACISSSTTTTTEGCGSTVVTYIDGPRVGNGAYFPDCSTSHFSLEVAREMCTADPSCSVLHDYNCDGRGWRYCSAGVGAIQASKPGTRACTQVATATAPAGAGCCSEVSTVFVDGPRVGNAAFYPRCTTSYFDLAEARSRCTEDSSCGVIHDYNCDGRGWRVCSAGLEAIQAEGGAGTRACTQVAEVRCATTTTTAEGCGSMAVTFLAGPRVGNGAYWPACSTAHFSLEEARSLCAGDPACGVIHDYNCDGLGWRHCSADLQTIQYLTPGTRACTEVAARSCAGAATTTETATATPIPGCEAPVTLYSEGPRVGNAAFFPHCSSAYFSLEEARSRCTEDPGCSAIHDYSCDAWGWRVCSSDIATLRGSHADTSACTEVAQVLCTAAPAP